MSLLALLLLSCTDDGKVGGDAGVDSGDPPVECTTWVGEHPTFCNRRPQNVLMISLDTLRRDHIGRYDDRGESLTPFLDSLLAESLALDAHDAQAPWTKPGTAMVLNGTQNYEWGHLLQIREQPPGPARTTLAGALASHGYDTVLRTTNGWLIDSGIDDGYASATHPDGDNATHMITIGMESWRQRGGAGSEPWFLHVHLKEPHAPYVPPDEYLAGLEDLPPIDLPVETWDLHYEAVAMWEGMSEEERALLEAHLRVRYEGEIRYLDDQLRDAWSAFDTLGMLDDTLVVFWTDHGEAFWEHDYQNHAWYQSPEETAGLALLWARRMQPEAWTGPTGNVDLAPTIMTALGLPVPEDWTGIPVGQAPEDRILIGDHYGRRGAVLAATRGDVRVEYRLRYDTKLVYDLSLPDAPIGPFDEENPEHVALFEALQPGVAVYEELVEASDTAW